MPPLEQRGEIFPISRPSDLQGMGREHYSVYIKPRAVWNVYKLPAAELNAKSRKKDPNEEQLDFVDDIDLEGRIVNDST